MKKLLLVFVAISLVIYLGVKDVLNPLFREDIQHTVYTMGPWVIRLTSDLFLKGGGL